jgi:hypothetical protein
VPVTVTAGGQKLLNAQTSTSSLVTPSSTGAAAAARVTGFSYGQAVAAGVAVAAVVGGAGGLV